MQIAKFGVNKSEANKECMKLSLQVLQFSESTQYVLSIDNGEYLLWRNFCGKNICSIAVCGNVFLRGCY